MKNTSFAINGIDEDITFVNGLLSYISYKSQNDILNKIMGGVTGFNNLYSDVNDLAIFAQMMLQRGYYSGRQYISVETIREFTSSQLPDSYAGLGWQTTISETNIFDKLPNDCYGFNSASGSSLWIDPDNKIFIIFLADSGNEITEKLIPGIQQEVYEKIISE